MSYKRYYDLEDYLFEEVGPKFTKEGSLNVEDFFCIVIWKANRAKTKIKAKLSNDTTLAKSIQKIASELFRSKDPKEKLNILHKNWKFGLPMATAILTVLYPKEFTVYDYRVRKQLDLKEIYSVKKYFEYFLPKVRHYSENHGMSLRDADKELWGKSFYDDLILLVHQDGNITKEKSK